MGFLLEMIHDEIAAAEEVAAGSGPGLGFCKADLVKEQKGRRAQERRE